MTKREKRLQYVRNRIKRLEKDQKLAIKLLVHSYLQLPELRKEEGRLETILAKRKGEVPPAPKPNPFPFDGNADDPDPEPPKDDDLEIPAALDRNRKLQAMADPKTKEKKAERRVIEKEKREADLRGQTRKWPATGKDALNALK